MTNPVINDLNKHINHMDNEAAKEEAISARVKKLLSEGGEFYPLAPENIQEALGNIGGELAGQIRDRLKKNDLLPIGHLVKSEVNMYWKARADAVARASVLEDITQRMLREIDDGRGNC